MKIAVKAVVKQMHMTSLAYLDLKIEEVVETYPSLVPRLVRGWGKSLGTRLNVPLLL